MTEAEQQAAVANAKAFRLDGDLESAEASIAALLLARPTDQAALVEGACLAWAREDWQGAAERYAALIAHHPDAASLSFHVRLARAWLNRSRPGRAAKALAVAWDAYPNNSRLVILRAQADIARGEGERALRYVLPYLAASGIKARRIHAALHRLFFRRGHVHAAYRIKGECARVYAQAPRPRSARARLQRAAAHGYLGDFASGHALVVAEPHGRRSRPEIAEQYLRYCELMTGRDPATVFRELYDAEGEDPDTAPTRPGQWSRDEFRRHLQGRSIAIVGPADTRQDLRAEIDAFDIVVRNNVFSTSDLDYSANLLGRRVDMAYYTGATFARRRAELIDFVRASGIIPVLRRPSNLAAARAAGLLNARACSPSPQNFLPNYNSMHSVQRMVWDLLKFEPRRVKLFNVTFYAGGMYSPGYRPRKKAPTLTSLGIAHDPLQGFRFTRNLRRLGVIECDAVATDILEWTEERYLDRLQTDYADHWRPPRRTPAAR